MRECEAETASGAPLPVESRQSAGYQTRDKLVAAAGIEPARAKPEAF